MHIMEDDLEAMDSGVVVLEGVDCVAAYLHNRGSDEVGDGIVAAWQRIQDWMAQTHIQSLEGSCYTTSRFVQDEFNRMGVSGGILEGCIEVGRNDYLEHRANLVRTVNFYAFIDLASRQFGRATDGFMIVSAPKAAVMKAALASEYSWC